MNSQVSGNSQLWAAIVELPYVFFFSFIYVFFDVESESEVRFCRSLLFFEL